MTVTTRLKSKATAFARDVITENHRELTLKECCLKPFVFLCFSKIYLKEYTKDWRQQYRGTSIMTSFLTYSITASLFISTFLMVISVAVTGLPYQTAMLLCGIGIGTVVGYIFTIQKEREAVNEKLREIHVMERVEVWEKLDLLKVYKTPRKN